VKKLLLLFPLLFLTGCLSYVQEVQLYPDGSGRMTINYWMKLPDSASIKILDRIGIFNADSIRHEFSSKYTKNENVQVYSDSTDSTTHAVVKFSFTNIDSLNNIKAFSEANFSLRDGAAGQKIFSQFIPPIATGFGMDGSNYNVTYKYKFSGEIITHNAQKMEGQTLTWHYTLAEIGRGKTISVTFRPYKLKETPFWIYIISGIVLLIVIIFLFRKKKD
jgi:hypothetical protein